MQGLVLAHIAKAAESVTGGSAETRSLVLGPKEWEKQRIVCSEKDSKTKRIEIPKEIVYTVNTMPAAETSTALRKFQ